MSQFLQGISPYRPLQQCQIHVDNPIQTINNNTTQVRDKMNRRNDYADEDPVDFLAQLENEDNGREPPSPPKLDDIQVKPKPSEIQAHYMNLFARRKEFEDTITKLRRQSNEPGRDDAINALARQLEAVNAEIDALGNGNPSNPSTPSNPNNSGNPNTPVNPSNPSNSGNPDVGMSIEPTRRTGTTNPGNPSNSGNPDVGMSNEPTRRTSTTNSSARAKLSDIFQRAKGLNAGQPSGGKPSTGTPSTGQPSGGKPSTGTPSTGQPSTGQPSTGQPSTRQPIGGKPSTEKPIGGTGSDGKPTNSGSGGPKVQAPQPPSISSANPMSYDVLNYKPVENPSSSSQNPQSTQLPQNNSYGNMFFGMNNGGMGGMNGMGGMQSMQGMNNGGMGGMNGMEWYGWYARFCLYCSSGCS